MGAFITCAAMHAEARTEQTQPNKRPPADSPVVPRRVPKAEPANLPHRCSLLLPVSPGRSNAVFSAARTGFSV